MQPYASTKIKPAITIVLSDEDNTELNPLHCMVCGKTFMEIPGNIKMVISGERGKDTRNVVQCHGRISIEENGRMIYGYCKARYWIAR